MILGIGPNRFWCTEGVGTIRPNRVTLSTGALWVNVVSETRGIVFGDHHGARQLQMGFQFEC